jgi:hypothetical protein
MWALAWSLLGQSTGTRNVSVTAVEGESWIPHVDRLLAETSMGKTWDLGPAPTGLGEEAAPWQLKLSPGYAAQVLTLRGSDCIA